MLRHPALFQTATYNPNDHWLTILIPIVLTLVLLGSSIILKGRLLTVSEWIKKGSTPENELLHAMKSLLFPLQLVTVGVFVGTILVATNVDSVLGVWISMGSLFSQLLIWQHMHKRELVLQNQIRKTATTSKTTSKLFARQVFGMFFLMAGSMAVAIYVSGAIRPYIGSIASFIVFFFLIAFIQILVSPIAIRLMLPSRKPTGERDLEIQACIHSAFSAMKQRTPEVRILELDHLKVYNALIAGFSFAPGPFRQIVLMSQNPAVELSHEETRAVINHELAHGLLYHIPIRVFAAITANLLGFASIFGIMMLTSAQSYQIVFPVLWVAFLLLVQPLVVGRLVNDQEKQADEFAVLKMGSQYQHLIAALTKLTVASGGLVDRKPPGNWMNAAAAHPTVLEREAHLQRVLLDSENPKRLQVRRGFRYLGRDPVWRAAFAIPVVFATSLLFIEGPKPASSSKVPRAVEMRLRTIASERLADDIAQANRAIASKVTK